MSEAIANVDPVTPADHGWHLIDVLLAELRKQDPHVDVGMVTRAFELASKAHHGQQRRSGEPYVVHPVRVAEIIVRLGLDMCSVVAALLHDAVEDSELSIYDLTESFGREVASIVDGVTKLGKIPYLSRQEQQAESFRKMLIAMSQDIRVLFVKLADRLDNMRTLQHMPTDKRERISRETMEIYAPLANRLGIEWMRNELQDLSFRYLQPAVYASVSEQMHQLLLRNPGFVERGTVVLEQAFQVSELERESNHDGEMRWQEHELGAVRIRATLRSPFKVHSMLEDTGRTLEQASELVTHQIIVRNRSACYAALGVLHSYFKPVPGRFRDYIALPRPNCYQALHTSVIDRTGTRLEVQVRSRTMDEVAERGIVARWRTDANTGTDARTLTWLSQLLDWQDDVSDPHEFIESVKADLFADEVYVFTPQGDIHTFPKGATPIDFAFAIHTDVGMRCSGARVNGHIVPLRYQLRQGDTVEILTNPDYGPRSEWLKMLQTPRARAKVKHYLRQQERTKLRPLGRSLVEQEMAARGIDLAEFESQGKVAVQAERLGLARELKGEDGIYEAVGAGQLSASAVADAMAPNRALAKDMDKNLFTRMLKRMTGKAPLARSLAAAGTVTATQGQVTSPIEITKDRVESTGGGVILLASCCNPIPGEPVLGSFLPGRGIVAHAEGCPEALEQVTQRRVYLAWQPGLELDTPVTLEVRTGNAVGLLTDMSRAFSSHGADIKQANCRAFADEDRAINTFHANVRNLRQLESIVSALKEVKGVVSVERVFTRNPARRP